MTAARWKLVIAELGVSSPPRETTVQADNWMEALAAGMQALGKPGRVPPGATCSVHSGSHVTVLDPTSRRKLTLTQITEAPADSTPTDKVSEMKQAGSRDSPGGDEQSMSRRPGSDAERGNIATTAADRRAAFRTVAFEPRSQRKAPKTEVAVGEARQGEKADKPQAAARAEERADGRSAPDAAIGNRGLGRKGHKLKTAAYGPQRPAVESAPRVKVGGAGSRKGGQKLKTAAYGPQRPAAASTPQVKVGDAGSGKAGHKLKTAAYGPQRPAAESAARGEVARATGQEARSGSPASGTEAEQRTAAQPAPAVPGVGRTAAKARTAAQREPASGAPSRPGIQAMEPQLEVVFGRDESPSDENPLTYIERVYFTAPGPSSEAVEAALLEQLAELQNLHREGAQGKFFNLAVFDHRWRDKPERPPVAVLQWKDWRGDPEVTFPLTESQQISEAPAQKQEGDPLAQAFEALHDLSFLSTPAEGLEFIVRLLDEAIPCAAQSAFLFDIDTHELRFVAGTGPEAEQRKAKGVPLAGGLLAQAARSEEQTTVVEQLEGTPYDPEIDGRPGLEARNMLIRPLAHDGHLIGMLQLINRVGEPRFTRQDRNLLRYVADQLTEFLRAARLRTEKRD